MKTAPTVVRLLGWVGISLITAWVGLEETGSGNPSPNPRITIEPDIPYRDHDGRRPRIDVYRPRDDHSDADSRYPAVLLVHGGSWIGGSKSMYRSDPQRNATRLAEHGFVVIAVDYLLGRPGRPNWPEALADLQAAVRWTRRNASRYRIDPNRIALLGQSAGGLLAMLAGTDGDRIEDGVSARVQAVISLHGPTNLESLTKARGSQRDPVFTFLGASTPEDRIALEAKASPRLRVNRSTSPMLLFHGSDDRWVPPDQARSMARVLDDRGVDHRLVIVEGARHGFETVVESPRRIDLLPEILAFLARVWNDSTADAPEMNHPSTQAPITLEPAGIGETSDSIDGP